MGEESIDVIRDPSYGSCDLCGLFMLPTFVLKCPFALFILLVLFCL